MSKTLTLEETKQHFINGDKIRQDNWPPTAYIYLLVESAVIKNSANELVSNFDLSEGNWELYTEPSTNVIESIKACAMPTPLEQDILTKLNEIIIYMNNKEQV